MNPAQADLILDNGRLRCAIAPLGAELRSLVRTADGEEFIWQRDPAWWTGSAPILFPLIGRLQDERYTYAGREYRIAKHGFARGLPFTIVEHTREHAKFVLQQSAATLAAWPFPFRLEVTFDLQDERLRVGYAVTNTGHSVMPCSLGSHPAVRLPAASETTAVTLTDWWLDFETAELPRCHRAAPNLLSSAPEPFAFTLPGGEGQGAALQLTPHLFDRDALMFRDLRSRRVTLRHATQGTRLVFDTGGAPTLAIWAKPGAPYVCLEPWWGLDDTSEVNVDLADKPGLMRLAPAGTFTAEYSIAV